MLESSVTISLTVHTLTERSSMIIRLIKRGSWRMKALPRLTILLDLTEEARWDRGSYSTVPRQFTEYLCLRNTRELDNHYQTLSESFIYRQCLSQLDTKLVCITFLLIILPRCNKTHVLTNLNKAAFLLASPNLEWGRRRDIGRNS